MAKSSTRTYSRYSRDAVRLLGLMIRNARTERELTVAELADQSVLAQHT